jgi:hypothetical protein
MPCSSPAPPRPTTRAPTCSASSCRVLGLEQLRPPGAHLPLDHGRRRSQHLGLRRDDQLLQRHATSRRRSFFIGSNAAEAHPVAMQHDPARQGERREDDRRRSALHPHGGARDQHVRFRPGTDIPLIWGMLWHIFENGWEDQEYINAARLRHGRSARKSRSGRRTWSRTSPACPETSSSEVAQTMAENRPGTIVWCMGGTQHTIGNATTCAPTAAAAGAGQHRQGRRRRQHLPRPRQRAGRDRRRPEPGQPARLLRPRRCRLDPLGPGLGRGSTTT